MGLLTRIVNPPDEQAISAHLFMAALAEVKRGAITLADMATAFGLDAGEQTELATFASQILGDIVTREQVHDVLMLGRAKLYTESFCNTRLLTGSGTNVLPLIVQKELEVLQRGANGDCVLFGCAVTAQASPDMTLAVSKGAVVTNGLLKPVTAGNVTITTADANMPRIDMVVANSSGTKTVRAGTAAPSPQPPTLSAGDVPLAFVYVPPADTAISSAQLLDCRIQTSVGPIVIGRVTSPVIFANSNAINTFAQIVLPNGLLTSGRAVRVECGGTALLNSGTSTLRLGITYGGSTMFDDTTGSSANDTDRLAWHLRFTLMAQASNDQALNGFLALGPVGAKTAATAGIGDLAVPGVLSGTPLIVPLNGSAAVDSDSADRTLAVLFQTSVANANVEVVMEYAIVELV